MDISILIGFNWHDEAIPELISLCLLCAVGSLEIYLHFLRAYRKYHTTPYDIAEAW
jgi:hypothetical protein